MMEMGKEKIETWKQKWKRMVRKNVNFHFQCFLLGDSGNVCALFYLQSVDAGTGETCETDAALSKGCLWGI